jgi:Protein of unknown function (DUF3105)
MAKRRTSGIQRRSRASDEALSRRIGTRRGPALDWRLLAIGGILVLGAVVLVLVLVFGGTTPTDNTGIGTQQPDSGRNHIAEGTQGGPYSSVPATSGPHWSSADSPGPWGVYPSAQPQERMLHNLEHGGVVIWYQPAKLAAAGLKALTDFVNQQITTERFKVILVPWSGTDFGHPIAVTAWNWLLYLDTPDLDKVRTFIERHYGDSPEPFGGPAKPGT